MKLYIMQSSPASPNFSLLGENISSVAPFLFMSSSSQEHSATLPGNRLRCIVPNQPLFRRFITNLLTD